MRVLSYMLKNLNILGDRMVCKIQWRTGIEINRYEIALKFY